MVEPISQNAILASMFGTPPARTFSIDNTNANRKSGSVGRTANADTYPQPTDSAEFSTDIQTAQPTTKEDSATDRAGAAPGTKDLNQEQQAEVRKLRQRDQEVRRHEQAHKAAAGSYATGAPSFEFTTGPDGKRYATGGEVSIDTSEVSGDPQATIAKMQQIRRAAQAPANPSGQDRAVAAQAAATERAAKTKLAEQRRSDSSSKTGANPISTTGSSSVSTGKSTSSRSPAAVSGTASGALLDLVA